jgi:hypothetical protein
MGDDPVGKKTTGLAIPDSSKLTCSADFFAWSSRLSATMIRVTVQYLTCRKPLEKPNLKENTSGIPKV